MAHFHSNALIGAGGQGGAAELQIDRSLRFNSIDDTYLFFNPSGHGNRKVFTFSFWVKRATLGTSQLVLYVRSGAGNTGRVRFDASDRFEVESEISGSAVAKKVTTAKFRDCSAWQHFVVKFDAVNTNCDIYHNGVELTAFDTNTEPTNVDHYFGGDYSHYLGGFADTESVDGYLAEVHMVNGQALAASDFGEYDDNNVWQPKAYSGSYGTNGFYLKFADNSSNAALGTDSSGNSNTWTVTNLIAERTANGTYGATISNSTLNYDPAVIFNGNPASAYVDRPINNSTVNFTGIPQANTSVKIYLTSLESGTMTTNGNYAVSPGSQFPNAYIEPTNVSYPFTLTSITVTGGNSGQGYGIGAIEVDGVVLDNGSGANTDQLLDSPTNYEADSGNNGGNYCTWNPLSTRGPTFTKGNLTVENSGTGSGGWRNIASNIAVSSGKWYMEFETVGSQVGGLFIGIQKIPEDNDQFNPQTFDNNFPGRTANSYALNCYTGAKRTNNSDSSYGSGMAVNDKIMMAVDLDNGKIWWGKNGTWFASGDPDSGTNAAFTGLSGTFVFAVGISANEKIHSNFGQRAYAYSNNISGFNSVCTQNLGAQAIDDGSTAFNATLYTGNGSARNISTPYGPDLVWIKSRSATYDHGLFDVLRGANQRLSSQSNGAEGTEANSVTAFNSDSFSLGSLAFYNNPSTTYVAWNWNAGTSTVSNTDGSITSQVRANTTAGFSIVKFTGDGSGTDTIGHGLNATPSTIWLKDRDNNNNWLVYTTAVDGSLDYLSFNQQSAKSDSIYTAPTSSVFSYGTDAADYIAYCFTPVVGYSQFGRYEGTQSADDGPFVTTGFRPRFLLIKVYDQSDNWVMWDSSRGDVNGNDLPLYPNLNNSETTNIGREVDFLSNGFKLRGIDNSVNGTHNYLYWAFAEHPFKTARAR